MRGHFMSFSLLTAWHINIFLKVKLLHVTFNATNECLSWFERGDVMFRDDDGCVT